MTQSEDYWTRVDEAVKELVATWRLQVKLLNINLNTEDDCARRWLLKEKIPYSMALEKRPPWLLAVIDLKEKYGLPEMGTSEDDDI